MRPHTTSNNILVSAVVKSAPGKIIYAAYSISAGNDLIGGSR